VNGNDFPGIVNTPPPSPPVIGIADMIQIRMALQDFRKPAKELTDAITKLDNIIASIITGFVPAPREGNQS